jgi:hypothetical protein
MDSRLSSANPKPSAQTRCSLCVRISHAYPYIDAAERFSLCKKRRKFFRSFLSATFIMSAPSKCSYFLLFLLCQDVFFGGIPGTPYNGTKLRGIVVKRVACLPAKSAKFPIKRHLAHPPRRSNMLNLVPLGTPYLFPTDICVPNSPIIEYGRRILSKTLLTTTDPRCVASSLTNHKSTLLG